MRQLLMHASVLVLVSALVGAGPPPGADVARLPDMEARCTDGSVLKVKLLHGSVTLVTRFGKTKIPLEKIKSIECANRIPHALSARVEKAIERLGHEDHDVRSGAEEELAKYKLMAYPALLKRETSPDLEVRMRVGRLLKAIREKASEEELTVRYTDVVHTVDSMFSGTLQEKALHVYCRPVGEAKIPLDELRVVRRPGVGDTWSSRPRTPRAA